MVSPRSYRLKCMFLLPLGYPAQARSKRFCRLLLWLESARVWTFRWLFFANWTNFSSFVIKANAIWFRNWENLYSYKRCNWNLKMEMEIHWIYFQFVRDIWLDNNCCKYKYRIEKFFHSKWNGILAMCTHISANDECVYKNASCYYSHFI